MLSRAPSTGALNSGLVRDDQPAVLGWLDYRVRDGAPHSVPPG